VAYEPGMGVLLPQVRSVDQVSGGCVAGEQLPLGEKSDPR